MATNNRINRRQFLKTAAGAAAGVMALPYFVASSALGKGGGVAAGNRITVGFIGTGGRGHWNMRAFMAERDVEVVAVCDVDAAHRASAAAKAGLYPDSGYNDFRALLARDDIDAVVISTPDHWHVPIAAAAARAGKDIYCEKPLSLTIAEGRQLCDIVTRRGAVFQTGSQQRSDSKFRFACGLVQSGGIGQIELVKVGLPGSQATGPTPVMPVPEGFDYDMWLGPAPWKPYTKARCHGKFRHIFDYSGGKFIDWGAHQLDIVQLALGAENSGPVRISGRGEFPKEGIYDTAVKYDIDFIYPNGVRVNAATQHTGGIRFEGNEGWIFVNRGIIETYPASLVKTYNPARFDNRSHVRNFIDSVRLRSNTIAGVEAGHRSATVCHLGNIAMRLARDLHWDPAAELFINDSAAQTLTSRSRRAPWRL
jgi:hypothetical protein